MGRHLPMSFLLFSIFVPGFCYAAAGNEQFVFSGFDDGNGNGNLTLDGAANISSHGILELTNNGENAKGHAFYPTPFRFKDSPDGTVQSFSAIFVFAIISGYPNTISTDGMAFLISPTTNLSDASVAQYMGFLDSSAMNHTVAVELDTVQNNELKDIDQNHVGLDIASRYSTPAYAAGFYSDKDGKFNDLNLDSGKEMQVWVDCDGEAKQISVTLAPMGVDKPSKPLFTTISDLSDVLPDQAYVGFSAGTGPIKSRHCVLAWSFAMNGPAPPIDYKKMPKLPSGSNTLSKILKIALPVAVLVLVLVIGIATIIYVRRGGRGRGRATHEADAPVEAGVDVSAVQTTGKHKSDVVGEPSTKKKKKLECNICLDGHYTTACPLLLGPKPAATVCALGSKGQGFFEIPYNTAAAPPKKVSATALVKIVEGKVSAELLKAELIRLIPVKWDWMVRPHGKNSFLVTFPCQVEMQRMVAIKRIPTDKNEGIMAFEEWSHEIKPVQKLKSVWVQVYGVPYEIRSFLPLWAVGSIIGTTQRVDMRHTRKNGVVRLLVGVLDVDNIPDDAEIVVDGWLYKIFFKVEHVKEDENFDDADDLDDNDGDAHGDEQPDQGEGDRAGDQEMEEADAAAQAMNNGSLNIAPSGSGSKPTDDETRIVEAALDGPGGAVQPGVEGVQPPAAPAVVHNSASHNLQQPAPVGAQPNTTAALEEQLPAEQGAGVEEYQLADSSPRDTPATPLHPTAPGGDQLQGATVDPLPAVQSAGAETQQQLGETPKQTHDTQTAAQSCDPVSTSPDPVSASPVTAGTQTGPGSPGGIVTDPKAVLGDGQHLPLVFDFDSTPPALMQDEFGDYPDAFSSTPLQGTGGIPCDGAGSQLLVNHQLAAEPHAAMSAGSPATKVTLTPSKVGGAVPGGKRPPPPPPTKELRRTTRSSVTDEHTLAKTERIAARRNLELPGFIQGNILAEVLVTTAA